MYILFIFSQFKIYFSLISSLSWGKISSIRVSVISNCALRPVNIWSPFLCGSIKGILSYFTGLFNLFMFNRVAKAVASGKTKVIDVDLEAYFDNVDHDILLGKVAQRMDDNNIMRLLKLILKANGKRGIAQGSVISPLLANIYLNEIDKMLEKAKRVTMQGKYTYIEYARFADDSAPRRRKDCLSSPRHV